MSRSAARRARLIGTACSSAERPCCTRVVGSTACSRTSSRRPATTHLSHLLEATFQLAEHLLGVAIGAFLNRGGFLAGAADQRLALLLGLLTELQRISLEAFGFGLAALLQANGLLADLLQLAQALLAQLFVLFSQLTLELKRFLIELLAALQLLLF